MSSPPRSGLAIIVARLGESKIEAALDNRGSSVRGVVELRTMAARRARIDDVCELLTNLLETDTSRRNGRAKRRGLGLGLVHRKLVEAHGGSLTAESAKGGGSAFRIWSPIADA